MIKIQVQDTDGSIRLLEVEEDPGSSLMEALVENDFDVPAICGGMASCGTCHLTFKKGFDKLGPKQDNELFMLDSLPNLTENSRLACQCPLNEKLDGAEVHILNDGA